MRRDVDTRRLEQIAETLITNKLLEAGILPAKPFFDQLGTDLIGFTSVDEQGRFCRIQCKYRTLKTRASVSVNTSYVDGAFILFIYVQAANDKWLYCFMPEEVRQSFKCPSTDTGSLYRLEISKKTIPTLAEYDYLRHPEERNAAIFHLMKVTSPNAELRKAISGLQNRMQELSELRRKYDRLQQLVHEMKLAEVQKKAAEDQIAILEEYGRVLEQQLREQES